MICLDSDFMIALLRGDKDTTAKTIELEYEKRTNVSTAINALELYIGIVAVEGVSGKRIEATRDFILYCREASPVHGGDESASLECLKYYYLPTQTINTKSCDSNQELSTWEGNHLCISCKRIISGAYRSESTRSSGF